jgi:hypothetical protein
MIGSTDTHTALSTADEDNFFGKVSVYEPNATRAEHPLALLFFNAGVEAGQLIFIATVLILIATGRHIWRSLLPHWAEMIAPYAIGSIAMLWVIQRISLF